MEYIIPAALEPWQAGTSYAKGAAFVHNGAVHFARQAVVSAEHQQPGSTGMEAIYGVRPIPDDDGVTPMYTIWRLWPGCASVKTAKHMSVRGISTRCSIRRHR